jgi:hypothetical protein
MGPSVVSVLEKLEVVLPRQYDTLFLIEDDTNLLLHMLITMNSINPFNDKNKITH